MNEDAAITGFTAPTPLRVHPVVFITGRRGNEAHGLASSGDDSLWHDFAYFGDFGFWARDQFPAGKVTAVKKVARER